jgi:hypothetical protein
MLDFSKCQCAKAGWCSLFKKEMTSDPPNWQWCCSLTEDQREKYYQSVNNKPRVVKKSNSSKKVDVINFYDNIKTPTTDYAICVVAGDETSLYFLKLSRDSIKRYAEKCGADYIELTGDQTSGHFVSNKFRVHQVSSIYKKTLFLGCEIVINEDAENIFNITPNDKISVYNESKSDSEEFNLQVETVAQHYGITSKHDYFLKDNIIVIPQSLADFYKQPEDIYPKLQHFNDIYLTLTTPEKYLNILKDTAIFSNVYDFIPVNSDPKPNPKRKNLVITVACGEEYENILSVNRTIEKYAKKCDADYIELRGKTQGWWGQEKFRIKKYVEAYERTLFVDADVVIKDGANNLFDIVPENAIGIHDDFYMILKVFQHKNPINHLWLTHDRKKLIKSQDVEQEGSFIYNIPTCYNTGVVLTPRKYSHIWTPLKSGYPQGHCDEQIWIEYNMYKNNCLISPLNSIYNTQWWWSVKIDKHPGGYDMLAYDDTFKNTERFSYFIHFANATSRYEVIKKYIETGEICDYYWDNDILEWILIK